MSLSLLPCFMMNFMAVIWPVHRRRPLYTCGGGRGGVLPAAGGRALTCWAGRDAGPCACRPRAAAHLAERPLSHQVDDVVVVHGIILVAGIVGGHGLPPGQHVSGLAPAICAPAARVWFRSTRRECVHDHARTGGRGSEFCSAVDSGESRGKWGWVRGARSAHDAAILAAAAGGGGCCPCRAAARRLPLGFGTACPRGAVGEVACAGALAATAGCLPCLPRVCGQHAA